jgi:Tol biopolymer transport system component
MAAKHVLARVAGGVVLLCVPVHTAQQVARFSYAHLAWAPDSRRIAYSSQAVAGAKFELGVIDLDGAPLGSLVLDSKDALLPAWSPDGRQLAFLSADGWEREVVIVDWSTRVQDSMPTAGLPDGFFSGLTWSVDGYLVYWFEGPGRRGAGLHGDAVALPVREACQHCYQIAWSPDRSEIAFVRGGPSQVMVSDADGSRRRVLTPEIAASWLYAEPSWSADGKRVTYSVVSSKHDRAGSIWSIRADGSDRRLVVSDGFGGRWSPDGKWIAYLRGTPAKSSPYGSEIRRAEADGTSPVLIAR